MTMVAFLLKKKITRGSFLGKKRIKGLRNGQEEIGGSWLRRGRSQLRGQHRGVSQREATSVGLRLIFLTNSSRDVVITESQAGKS